jgi:hypothetical protein
MRPVAQLQPPGDRGKQDGCGWVTVVCMCWKRVFWDCLSGACGTVFCRIGLKSGRACGLLHDCSLAVTQGGEGWLWSGHSVHLYGSVYSGGCLGLLALHCGVGTNS